MRCSVCGLRYRVNPDAPNRCVAHHEPNGCCHVGCLIIDDEGRAIVVVPWPSCVLVPSIAIAAYDLPPERSNEAVGCECPPHAMARVHIVERPGLTTTTLQCQNCFDARVIRSKVPK